VTEAEPHADAYRAIGRHVVEYSALVAAMRSAIEHQLTRDDPMIPRLALAQASQKALSNAFFAICEREADFSASEKKIAARLKGEVTNTMAERNNFAHGDWEMGFGILGDPQLVRTKLTGVARAWVATIRPANEIDALSDELVRLTDWVLEFAWICFRVHPLTQYKHLKIRVSDIFQAKGKRVQRTGPLADETWFDED